MRGPGSPVGEAETDAEERLPEGAVPVEHLELAPGTVAITDLHLSPVGDPRTDTFIRWCDGLRDAPRLLILGDLFDMWVGPRQARLPGTARALAALRRLTDRGVGVDVVPGNRDALMGAAFEAASGARLWHEGFVADLGGAGRRAAFVHGDALCTLDAGYQRLRRVWRNGAVRRVAGWTPLWAAGWIGRRLRRASEAAKPRKVEAQRSIRPLAVQRLAEQAGVEMVVCGHAHEPIDVALSDYPETRGSGVRWLVLGAWRMHGLDLLTVEEGGRLAVETL